MRPLIFDVQRFSIHDGPGIRTVVFFKGCNLKCPWCQNPESMATKHEIAFYPERCTENRDCVASCANDALSFDNGFHVNRRRCEECKECTVNCFSDAIRIVGKESTAEELMQEILRDQEYYKISGGGVTFSGGEPTLHIGFLQEMLLLCKQHDIHTNIETNGCFSWNKFKAILPLLDMIYFDIKIADNNNHKRLLSQGNERILYNIEQLINAKAPVHFRMPLIPKFTCTDKNLRQVIGLLKKFGIEKIHLLPYHSMGESKGEKVGSPLAKLGFKPFTPHKLKTVRSRFECENIETILYN